MGEEEDKKEEDEEEGNDCIKELEKGKEGVI